MNTVKMALIDEVYGVWYLNEGDECWHRMECDAAEFLSNGRRALRDGVSPDMVQVLYYNPLS